MPYLPNPSHKMPTLYVLFHKFWIPQTLRKICAEINIYASEIYSRFKCTPKSYGMKKHGLHYIRRS
jgi:hypothetical protein